MGARWCQSDLANAEVTHEESAGSSTGGLAKEVGRKGEAIGKTLEEGARLEQVD